MLPVSPAYARSSPRLRVSVFGPQTQDRLKHLVAHIPPEAPGPTPVTSSCAVSTFVYNDRSDRFFSTQLELSVAFADEAERCGYEGIWRAADRLEQAEIGGIERCAYIT